MRKVVILLFLMLLSSNSFAQEKSGFGNVEAGKKIYTKRCIFCHGEQGGGDGPAAERFNPRPRDFTMGLFKYRTTPNGMIPTDDDLFKVVTKGLPGTGMPSWESILSSQERRDVIAYVKTFTKKFERQKEALPVIEVGKEIASSDESIEKGRALFKSLECFKCHGNEGRGNGPSALTLTDDKGDPIRPRNLTLNWHFRGGGEAKDIYMRVNTGLNGTPMPSFKDSLDNEKSWHLANFVRSLSPSSRPEINGVIKSKKVLGNIPADPSDPFWQDAGAGGGAEYWFPMVGQVIREPRHFTPTVRDIFVKSVYSDKEIAFLLRWNDPSESKDGEPLPVVGGEGDEDLFEGATSAGGEEKPVATALDDAVAIQFPSHALEGLRKPYFLMGDEKNGVNLWTWKAGRLQESNANGIDKEVVQGSANQALSGGGGYHEGQYKVVIKRSLMTADQEKDMQFEAGKFVPIAFYAWDGHNAESNTKRSISHWYFLLLEPPIPRDVYVKPPLVAFGVFGCLLLLQRKLRKNHGKL
ncbi:MAG: c-type cytochrome [Nitrospirae bacterium]|nr:c-type cytochrome [Candidatus Troglogloeales bacterium]